MLDQLLRWAANDQNIRAVVITGSVARGTPDRYSDLDIELYAVDPTPLLDYDEWHRRFGTVLVVEALENDGWNPTRLVYYAGGKIDFTILSASLLELGVGYPRAFRVLLDKDDRAAAFRSIPLPPAQPPSEAEFLECLHWFYAAVIMWAKQVARNDPFAAKLRDQESKGQLLRMLEWDHRARWGWDYDTWYLSVHMRDWVDPDLLAAIEASWCGLDPAESARAIRTSLALFDLLSTRTAHVLGHTPFDSSGVRGEVERLLSDVA
jgi:aminoglycoside 6-adenylyltransferase